MCPQTIPHPANAFNGISMFKFFHTLIKAFAFPDLYFLVVATSSHEVVFSSYRLNSLTVHFYIFHNITCWDIKNRAAAIIVKTGYCINAFYKLTISYCGLVRFLKHPECSIGTGVCCLIDPDDSLSTSAGE